MFLMVPPVLTLLQTEFCNPVFEGEEHQAALSTEHPPGKDRTSPKSSPDGLGTSLGAWMHMPVQRATRSSCCSGSGVVGQFPCRALGLIRGPASTPGTRGWDMSSQGSASHAGRKQRGGKASSTLALPAFLLPAGQQLWGQAGWQYRADCKFTWLCVALMSAVLLFLIALLLGIVIHRECPSRESWGWGRGHRTSLEVDKGTARVSILLGTS